jgi:hypothetical protein
MTTALSPVQRRMLRLMHTTCNGISYADRRDRTLMALQRRGLVTFSPRRKYGRDCWQLSDTGHGRACQIVAADHRLSKSDENALLGEIMR